VAELQRERNNKLMNLEAMAASISHEVRQPLGSIATNGSAALRFLEHGPPNVEEVRSALNRIISDSHRASLVFDNIRALFGKGDEECEPIDVNELIRGVLSTVQGDLNDHGIVAGVRLPEDLPKIIGHKGQLEEVLINLVRNAIEAMQTDQNDRRLLQVSSGCGGDKIIVAVEDSGPGIDPKHGEGIFDAFFTTKSHGMGLGLALCRMIIGRHSGELTAWPAHPHGSIFRIVLPIGRRGLSEFSASHAQPTISMSGVGRKGYHHHRS
jgi:C4-dicarboxylate-specific signal transduction histidine kinase